VKPVHLLAAIALGLGLTVAVAWGIAGALNASSQVDWDYRGVTCVSWTRGDYPWTTSWRAQTYTDSQAITAVSITTSCAHSGAGGLAMVVDLVGGHPNKGGGEAFVDLRYHPPLLEPPCCVTAPIDLDGIPICAYVWSPAGSGGNPSRPNGLQVLVKDENWKGFYGNWHNIQENQWNYVCATPGTTAPPLGHVDPGFDPTRIVLLGVKIGAGSGSTAAFSGTMCLDDVGWTAGGCNPAYTFENVKNSLDKLQDTHANYVSLVTTWYMDTYTSPTISPDPGRTHTDAEIVDAIEAIRNRGMDVMLKPHVDVMDDTWRGVIDPVDEEAWFASYTSFITHYAEIAQDNGVELFCIGTELESLVTGTYRPDWVAIVNAIKQTYAGKLIYAANWDGHENVSFWDQVDLAGIDAYFPLSNDPDPPLDGLVEGWTHFCYTTTSPCYTYDGPVECHNWVDEIENWQRTITRPVVFTEIGYQSADCAAATPWDADSTTPNCGLQARCYEAVFRVFKDKPWFLGAFWWAWTPLSDAGGCCDTDFTPQNKPAESALTGAYERHFVYLPIVLKDYPQ
jgi:hypothetical protein